MAFISDRTGDKSIWLLHLASKTYKQLTGVPTTLPISQNGKLDWSPDGTKIIFRSSRPKTEEEIKEYTRFNDLLAQRNKRGYLPVYPDGTPRPISTWLGLSAFIQGKRLPDTPQPDEIRSREHRAPEMTLSWRHPLTEIMTAFFFALVVIAFRDIDGMTTAQYLINFVYMAIFSLIIVIDMEHKLILFIIMIPSIILALLDAYFVSSSPTFFDAMIGAGLGFAVFFGIYLFGFAFRWFLNTFRGKNITTVAFGYGDVIMLTFTGALLGTLYTLVAIFLTTLLGAIGAFMYLIVKRIISGTNATMTAIPYGPYIVIATLIMVLWGNHVWDYIVG